MACETLLTTGLVVVAGEVTTSTYVDIPAIVRETVCDIGYDNDAYGFNGKTCGVLVSTRLAVARHRPGRGRRFRVPHRHRRRGHAQRPGCRRPGDDVRLRLRRDADLMPLPIWLAHRLSERLAQVRRVGALPYLRPDGKTQVSVVYENGRPVRIDTVLISTQHAPGIDLEELLAAGPDRARDHAAPADRSWTTEGVRILANPTGMFELGGPHADTGLTGRKIIVDTYGGMARHGGGAFSGKDPSKVDRSAAYAARWVAKHVVAVGRRHAGARCRWPTPSAWPSPVSLHGRDVRHRDGRSREDRQGASTRSSTCARRPSSATSTCAGPIYKKTAAYGHFGRSEKEFTWEATPRVDDLRSALGPADRADLPADAGRTP